MSENPFDKLIQGINKNFEELGELFEKNQEALEKVKENSLVDLEAVESLRKNVSITDEEYLRSLAGICLGDLDVLATTLANRTKKNAFETTDAAVFLSILTAEQKESVLAKLPDKERYLTITELDTVPEMNRQNKEMIIFNIQAEYFMRMDGEDPDIDLFTDLFK